MNFYYIGGTLSIPNTTLGVVPRARIELATQGFSVLRSTTELPRLFIDNTNYCIASGPKGIRTPDHRLAKAPLYQLSYGPFSTPFQGEQRNASDSISKLNNKVNKCYTK